MEAAQRIAETRDVIRGNVSGDSYRTTTTAKYVWEGDSYYDPLVLASFSGQWRYYAYDALGSTRQLLDANQTVTDSYSYEAFGNLLSDGGGTPNPYTYVGSLGYYATAAPHLIHVGARYYIARIGRFATRDPEVGLRQLPSLERREAAGWHPYTYVRNNPELWTDPTGLGFRAKLKKYAYCINKCWSDLMKCTIWGNPWVSLGTAALTLCCMIDEEPITKALCCGFGGASGIAQVGTGLAALAACTAECLRSGGEPPRIR